MKVSIVMTAYKRAGLLDNTFHTMITQTRLPDEVIVVEDGGDDNETWDVCHEWRKRGLPISYYHRVDRPKMSFSNAAIPKNIGIQKSTGDIIVLQCAEVKYLAPTDLANVVRPVEEDPMVTCFARAKGTECPNLMVEYCQAIRREHIMAIGGFEEIFKGYAFEDCNFQLRLKEGRKLKFQWAEDVLVEHQWHDREMNHESVYRADFAEARRIEVEIARGHYVANEGRPWGVLKHTL